MTFEVVKGTAGWVQRAAGSRPAIINHWTITRSGIVPGTNVPRLRFRASFSFVNNALMDLPDKLGGSKRVFVQLKNKDGIVETKELLSWGEWKYDGSMLTLEDVVLTKGGKIIL